MKFFLLLQQQAIINGETDIKTGTKTSPPVVAEVIPLKKSRTERICIHSHHEVASIRSFTILWNHANGRVLHEEFYDHGTQKFNFSVSIQKVVS